MNGPRSGYRGYHHKDWDDDNASRSSSSGYDVGSGMSPYRTGDPRPPHPSVPSNGYSSDAGSVGSTEDCPTFVLEHLATFRVSKDSDLQVPADGMKRLLHMEKTTGIWTQKMLLRLDKKWVMILSHENGDIVERFPMELIREPTAFTSEDPKELYNNIFIFVVEEDPKQKYNNLTEMHIFQCLRVGARDVVEDMKMFMSGKSPAGRGMRGGHIPPPPQEPAPEPPHHMNGYRDYSDSEVRGDTRGPKSERSSVSHTDDISSTGSEKYEKDISVLNSCFDDIERFIARLQHTAAATRELEKRRKARKSKKKDIGDGLLSMRAKPPPERDFFDIFQKFKLSFNLLAKLRSHIHDPNAPELVHFLFSPLALIADASRDSSYGPNPPAKVVSPLLTRDAIDLLTNCLTSRETELWQSFGDPWIIPRDAWKYPVAPYQPVFSSGWAPEILDEASHRSNALATQVASEAKLRQDPDSQEGDMKRVLRDDYDYYDSDRTYRDDRPRSLTPPSEYPQAGRSDISQESIDHSTFERQQKLWLNDMKGRGVKIVQVTYPRTANNDRELTVERGEYLEVLDDSRKWWKALNFRGQMAHVPHTIVTPYSSDPEVNDSRQPPPPSNSDWVKKERQGKKDKITFSHSTDDEDDNRRRNRTDSIPAPPPPPPTDFSPESTVAVRSPPRRPRAAEQMFGTTKSQSDVVNEELQYVLAAFRRTRPHLEISKTPDVFVNATSSPKQIQKWLQLKGFSSRICKQFDGVDGEKLFALTRNQLEKYCGENEGRRLDSQITIQRNVSGYKTARSSELKHILAQRRKKVDDKVVEKHSEDDDEESDGETLDLRGPEVEKSKPRAPPMKRPTAPPVVKTSKPSPPRRAWAPPETNKPKQRQSYNSKAAQSSVTNDFKFLNDYDTKSLRSGYRSDSDEPDSPLGKGKNTLREQIKKQRKKIIHS